VLRDYQPQAYAGRIVHIKAEASTYDPQLVAKLTAGGLEAYELPCRHGEIIKEPHVAVWANQLKSYLQEAQATQRGTHPSVSPREDNEKSHLEQAIATR
jgi:thioesterase domain-containing protein